MAMQVGMGLSRIVLLVGAGVTGSIVLRNGRLSEILAEIQEMLQKVEKGKGEGETDVHEALTNQVRRLSMEIRQLSSSRPITVLSGGSGQTGVTAMIVPAATLGALGYGYMWWKGISFSDLMYVTKRNMATAVASMTKHLEQVNDALSRAKKHLTQRIQKLDDKLDEQKAISGIIKNQVTDARVKLENIGSEIKSIKELVFGLDGKIDSLEEKQNFSCAGVMYLCNFIEANGGKMTGSQQNGFKLTGKRFGGIQDIKGLQHIVQAIDSGNYDKSSIDAIMGDSDSSDKLNRSTSFKIST